MRGLELGEPSFDIGNRLRSSEVAKTADDFSQSRLLMAG